MQRLEVSGVVRPLYGLLGVKGLNGYRCTFPEKKWLLNSYLFLNAEFKNQWSYIYIPQMG